jgi:hypothetical protein
MSAVADTEGTLHPLAIVLNFASSAPVEEVKDGDTTHLWKDILREGVIAITPGQKTKVPFSVVPSGRSSSTRRIVSLEDIIKSFDAKAFDDVTIPDGHPKPDRVDPQTQKLVRGDSALNNTGYIRNLRIVQKDVDLGEGNILKDCHVMQADMGFTEPDVAQRVKRGSVPNVSSGIFFDWVRKADDRYFPCALNHVALTKHPWMSGLEGFPRVFFGDDTFHQEGVEFEVVNFDEPSNADDNDAKVIWIEGASSQHIRRSLEQVLNPPEEQHDDPTRPYQPRAYYYVVDVTHNDPNLAQVEESYKGKTTNYVVPYSVDDNGAVTAAPSARWIEGKTAMIAASDEHGDPMASFASLSHGKLVDKLSIALSDLLGEGPAKDLVVEETSLDSRALLRNKANGAVFLAQFYQPVTGHVFFAESSTWETIKAPAPKPAEPTTVVPMYDLSTPEGRVRAARQRRRQPA